jgi:hypothetical protein
MAARAAGFHSRPSNATRNLRQVYNSDFDGSGCDLRPNLLQTAPYTVTGLGFGVSLQTDFVALSHPFSLSCTRVRQIVLTTDQVRCRFPIACALADTTNTGAFNHAAYLARPNVRPALYRASAQINAPDGSACGRGAQNSRTPQSVE